MNNEGKEEKVDKLYHAFYSQKQLEGIQNNIIQNNRYNPGYRNWLTTNGTKVQTTCLFGISKYPKMEDCELFFDDYKYQGIVYKCLDP